MDDVDTEAEDHTADEARYVILSVGDRFSTASTNWNVLRFYYDYEHNKTSALFGFSRTME